MSTMTDTERITALEAEVKRLSAELDKARREPDGRAVMSAIRREIRLGGASDFKRDLGIR